ncbi:four-carbon acid sugar kinase family protein [Photobacterium profundum]|uniref:four-carbon acid sugar kinase family protein n=1 Tax=Photobacterium profundum TaxID=74109 RepID=UPI003D0C56CC
MPKLIVIADDFTGSNDTGVQLAKKGALVAVALGGKPVDCDIPVINTESRALQQAEAIDKVTAAVTKNIDEDTRIVFKKIDSTFRGNIGAEIEAAAKAFGATLIVVAAAIPAAKRTTINGICLVNGIPVTDTEFATDPKTPVHHADIASIIGCQSNLPCQSIALSHIRANYLDETLQQVQDNNKPQVLILDAETDADLATIANLLVTTNGKIVLVGAAGIANQLPKALFIKKTKAPVLILAGSMSKITQQQVDYCQQNGLHVIDIDAQDIWHHPDMTLSHVIEHAGTLLRQGKHCAIRTARNQAERQRAKQFCLQHNISGTKMGDTVAHFLGQLGKALMESYPLSGVLFTGGDIATAVAAELGADGYIIKGEIQPCIPHGHFTQNNTTVVTKAGGFGTVDAIEHIITYLQDNS